MGAYAGAARCCIHFPPVLQGPLSGHPPSRCLVHPHHREMLINLLQPSMRHLVGPLDSSTHETPSLNLVSRISVRKTSHMSIQPQVTLTDYASNKSHLSLSLQPLIIHKVRPAIAKDLVPKELSLCLKSLVRVQVSHA